MEISWYMDFCELASLAYPVSVYSSLPVLEQPLAQCSCSFAFPYQPPLRSVDEDMFMQQPGSGKLTCLRS